MTRSKSQPAAINGGFTSLSVLDASPGDKRFFVLSDTHVGDRVRHFNPQLLAIIANYKPDAILHAGDVSTPAVIAELERIAPVLAVQGNRDWLNRFRLPRTLQFSVNGVGISLTHGHINMWEYLLNYLRLFSTGKKMDVKHFRERLAKLYPRADLIIFGHTHFQIDLTDKGQRFFNPGAAYPHLLNHNQIQYGLLLINAAGEIQIEKKTLTTETRAG